MEIESLPTPNLPLESLVPPEKVLVLFSKVVPPLALRCISPPSVIRLFQIWVPLVLFPDTFT